MRETFQRRLPSCGKPLAKKDLDGALRQSLEAAIREVPDFPTPGITFKDITPLLADARLFAQATDAIARAFLANPPSHIAAIESRGFLLGGPIAQRLNAGLIPVRKPGKLPGPTETEHYSLEYGADALQIHRDAVGPSATVLIVDDVLATGGTMSAARRLVERLGARAVGGAVLVELTFLSGRATLGDWPVHSLVRY